MGKRCILFTSLPSFSLTNKQNKQNLKERVSKFVPPSLSHSPTRLINILEIFEEPFCKSRTLIAPFLC